MYTVLLVIHVMVTFALIGIILVQRPAGDGMGLSGSSSTSFMSGRTAANFITRTTATLGTLFILTSLCLGWITAHSHTGGSFLDKLEGKSAVEAPAAPKQEPAKLPSKPAVPRPE